MNEETSQRTVALVIRSSRLTEEVLRHAMLRFLEERSRLARKTNEKHGKISVRKLMGKDQGAQIIEINNSNIKGFERIAKKYNVDFAVRREKGADHPKYIVFFKNRDMDVISMAFKDFCNKNEKKRNRGSVREKLSRNAEKAKQREKRERTREKDRNREQAR